MVLMNRRALTFSKRFNRILALKFIGKEIGFKHKPHKATYPRLVEHNATKIFLSLFICVDNQAF
jgi:hypothetical protein